MQMIISLWRRYRNCEVVLLNRWNCLKINVRLSRQLTALLLTNYRLRPPLPPPLPENTCCKQNNVLMSLKPSFCSMVIFSQADWYALSILFGILPALIKKKAQVITTCSYTHSCRHLPKDYWNETNDLNNNNCENRKKEEKKHFCFGGVNRNAYVLNTSMNWALPSGSSGT